MLILQMQSKSYYKVIVTKNIQRRKSVRLKVSKALKSC